MRGIAKVGRLFRSFAVLSALAMGPIVTSNGQTQYCSLDTGCFVYAYTGCMINCPCVIGLPPQQDNSILILSCPEGFVGCCSCCSSV